jgi:hypothetical protein
MIRLIYLFVIGYLLYRLIKGVVKTSRKYQEKNSDLIDDMVQCPFCETYIPRKEAVMKDFKGNVILFCSKDCSERFEFRRD